MDSKITRLIEQASVIVGALPYLQAYRDKTFLIKFGGSAMDDTRLVKKLMRDIVLLEVLGFNPVIVHGGGKAISKAMAEAGLEARFVNGLRVTTPEAISIVERTLSGTINPGLVQMFRDYGGKGVGIPGTEIFVGERIHEKDEQGNPIDIGEVGNVIGCLTERITEALELQITPIVSPLAKELGTHKPLNVNADLAAAALAKEEATGAPACAMVLPDGRVVTGKTSSLLGASAALLLNALKAMAGIRSDMNLISNQVIEPISALKIQSLGHHNPRLHSDEVLIALAISALTNPLADMARAQLGTLRGCDAHFSVIISEEDIKLYKRLGIHVSCEPKYESKRLYHK